MGLLGARRKGLRWEAEAREALQGAPAMVRPLARRKIEERVRAEGRETVTLADYQAAYARFKAVLGNKSEEELQALMPQENKAGAELVIIEACRSKLSGCPNPVLDTEEWRTAIEEWEIRERISERIRAKVEEDKILFHHKLKISLSGCPNGCSRPQIVDFGILGTTRPEFDWDCCSACLECARACPDKALTEPNESGRPLDYNPEACLGCGVCERACEAGCITTSAPRAKLLMAGKLGRRPHLGHEVGTFDSPREAVGFIDEKVAEYLEKSRSGQRFADYWIEKNGWRLS